ncbi:MAG: hypothetical protein GC199_11365 [Alphaproteobacteria bacterium]|nr:hypothetical protein [Alphaproteobacteria bacterium]
MAAWWNRETVLTLTLLGGLLLLLAAIGYAISDSAAWHWALGWVQAQQRALHGMLADAVRALREEDSAPALWALISLSFLYGVLHAAGPGHGKAIISAYLVATGDTVRRGIVLAFLGSLAQGLTAIVLVAGASWILGISARAMTQDASVLEQASYLLIAMLGLWLFVREARPLLFTMTNPDAASRHDHAHGGECGHDHAAEARLAANPLSLTAIAGLIASVGIRPCLGALLVLIFAFGQSLPLAGIAAVLAMSLGTGTMVAVLAAATATARGPGLAAMFGGGTATMLAARALGLGGALALTLFGAGLFLASTGAPPSPFGL